MNRRDASDQEHFQAPAVETPHPQTTGQLIGHLLGSDVERRRPPRAVIIGFPCDEGVRRCGGRTGASEGPAEIRRALYRLTPDPGNPAFGQLIRRTRDLGDLILSGDLEQDQALLGIVLAHHLKAGVIPILLGGGPETVYGHFLGYVNAGLDVDVLSWDSQARVAPLERGLGHAQSPCRQALMHPSQRCLHFTVAGLQPHSASATQLDFISNHSGRYFWKRTLTTKGIDEAYSAGRGRLMVNFCLEAVDQAQAPGVASPCLDGMSPQQWLEVVQKAGRSTRVNSLDLVAHTPRYDRDRHTAGLASLTIWRFLSGLSARFS